MTCHKRMKVKRRLHRVVFVIQVTLLLLAAGCVSDKKETIIVAGNDEQDEPLPERYESDDLPQKADELFDDFFYYYAGNSTLQHRRTLFPLPVTDAEGKKVVADDSAWTVNRFFMDQGLYVRIFDTQEQCDLPSDTTVERVVVEHLFFEKDSLRQYCFQRNEGRWQLNAIAQQPLKDNPNAHFLHFYHDFATDSVFQRKSLSSEIAFSGPDPDDDFATMEGFITPESWEVFAPELPRDSIYNIVYGSQSSRSKEKIFVVCGIANGMETVLTFRLKRGKWKLVRIEN